MLLLRSKSLLRYCLLLDCERKFFQVLLLLLLLERQMDVRCCYRCGLRG